MKDYRKIIKSKLYRQDGAATLAQESAAKINAVKKTVLEFGNYLRENVGGFDDEGRKKFIDALQDTTLEILAIKFAADDLKATRRQAVIKFYNILTDKINGVNVKAAVFSIMVDYIVYRNLN